MHREKDTKSFSLDHTHMRTPTRIPLHTNNFKEHLYIMVIEAPRQNRTRRNTGKKESFGDNGNKIGVEWH